MKTYVVAQKVKVGINDTQWVDLVHFGHQENAFDFIEKVKETNSDIVLGLRSIEEIEIELERFNER